MSAIDREQFPRAALFAAGGLVLLTLVITGAARIAKLNAPPAPASVAAAPASSVDLNFVDEANGAVTLREHGTGRLVLVLQPGEDGFIRSVVRGLARERRSHGIGAEPAFRLSEWQNGRLQLEDLSTGRTLDLQAFGPTNRDAFARILRANEAKL